MFAAAQRFSWPGPQTCAGRGQQPAPQHARAIVCLASRKKKSGGNSSGSGKDSHRLQDAIRESREQQLAATDMLAKLLQAEEPAVVAKQYVSSLDEAFFWSANTYLAMAKKEGNQEVISRLEAALKAAFEAKQATLRPEIQLLNRLLATETAEQRKEVLDAPQTAEQLTMNDRYFFSLLGRMLADVGRQPDNEQKAALLRKLEAIQQDAQQRAPVASA